MLELESRLEQLPKTNFFEANPIVDGWKHMQTLPTSSN